MKIIIAGAGKVGKTLTKELSADGYEITLIDKNPIVLETISNRYDVITYEGNAATVETLEEAGINETDVFIAATSADEVNVLACMTARALNKDVHVIARVRDPEYVSGLLKLSDHFHLSLVINPEREAAIEIASLLKLPEFNTSRSLEQKLLNLELNQLLESRISDWQTYINVYRHRY